ncbi:MAG: protoporphyrinogen oxidase [Rhodoglobus sp.]|nr:protoporphyrinogen oxidase [Rhodoglobus sp.]
MVPDFAVIGGGIAGLVVARRLAMAGRSVTLLEASDHLGGTVLRHEVGGIDLDAGAESFATRGGSVAALATELGLGNDIVTPSAAGAWLQPVSGPAVPLPATSLLGIPGVPLASDVIAAVGLGSALRAQLDSVIPHLVATKSLTLGALVRRRMGNGVLEKLVAPVVHGVHSMHPDELPLDRAAPGLRAALALHGSLAVAVRSMREAAPAGSAVQGIRGGVWRLVTELTADLETYGVQVELGRRVTSVDGLDGTVVLTTPLEEPPGRTVVLATLVVDAPELDAAPRGSGVLVAQGAAGIRARALTHATAKWQWLRERADGHHVLRLSYEVEPEDLAAVARQDAEALLGVKLDRVIDFARVQWLRPEAGTAADVGETVAGSGLAGIVAQAEAHAAGLLAAD